MKAIMMVANRNFTLRSIFGSQTFEKDVPTLVAPQLIKFALEKGVLPADGEKLVNEKVETEQEPIDGASRGERIADAIELIYKRNNADDFTTGATPKLKAVAKYAGLKKVSSKEVKDILDARNQAALDAELEEKAKAQATKPAAEDPPDNDL